MHERTNAAALSNSNPHMKVFLTDQPRRRLFKTVLWNLYWEVNKIKVWIYFMHLEFSTGQWERELWSYLQVSWAQNDGPLNWFALWLVYI